MRKGSYSEESTLDHDRKRLNRVEDVYDEHLDGDAPDALIAYGQTAETCGHEANILKQKVPKFSETLCVAPCILKPGHRRCPTSERLDQKRDRWQEEGSMLYLRFDG